MAHMDGLRQCPMVWDDVPIYKNIYLFTFLMYFPVGRKHLSSSAESFAELHLRDPSHDTYLRWNETNLMKCSRYALAENQLKKVWMIKA